MAAFSAAQAEVRQLLRQTGNHPESVDLVAIWSRFGDAVRASLGDAIWEILDDNQHPER